MTTSALEIVTADESPLLWAFLVDIMVDLSAIKLPVTPLLLLPNLPSSLNSWYSLPLQLLELRRTLSSSSSAVADEASPPPPSSFRFAAGPCWCDAAAAAAEVSPLTAEPRLLLDVVVNDAALGADTAADIVDIVTTLVVVDGVCGGVVLRFTGCPLLPPQKSLRSLLTRVTETADAAADVAEAEAAAFGETAAEDLEEEFPLRERGDSGAGDWASRCLMLSFDPS